MLMSVTSAVAQLFPSLHIGSGRHPPVPESQTQHLGHSQSKSAQSVNPSQSLSMPSPQTVSVPPHSESSASVHPSQSLSMPSWHPGPSGPGSGSGFGTPQSEPGWQVQGLSPRAGSQMPFKTQGGHGGQTGSTQQSGSAQSIRLSQSLSMLSPQTVSVPPHSESSASVHPSQSLSMPSWHPGPSGPGSGSGFGTPQSEPGWQVQGLSPRAGSQMPFKTQGGHGGQTGSTQQSGSAQSIRLSQSLSMPSPQTVSVPPHSESSASVHPSQSLSMPSWHPGPSGPGSGSGFGTPQSEPGWQVQGLSPRAGSQMPFKTQGGHGGQFGLPQQAGSGQQSGSAQSIRLSQSLSMLSPQRRASVPLHS